MSLIKKKRIREKLYNFKSIGIFVIKLDFHFVFFVMISNKLYNTKSKLSVSLVNRVKRRIFSGKKVSEYTFVKIKLILLSTIKYYKFYISLQLLSFFNSDATQTPL